MLLLVPAYAFLQQSVLHRPLQERATRDAKTGLLHFNAWQRLASVEVRRLNATGSPWGVLFADIDNFRFYNERYGHLGGDNALTLVSQIITAHLRPRDITARFGGEEFCVLLPDTQARTAEQVAERIRLAVSTQSRALPEVVTISVGVAAIEAGGTPMELAVVLAMADQALYQAKVDGRDLVRMAAATAVQTDPPTAGPARATPGRTNPTRGDLPRLDHSPRVNHSPRTDTAVRADGVAHDRSYPSSATADQRSDPADLG